jgi:hypothetical protein
MTRSSDMSDDVLENGWIKDLLGSAVHDGASPLGVASLDLELDGTALEGRLETSLFNGRNGRRGRHVAENLGVRLDEFWLWL